MIFPPGRSRRLIFGGAIKVFSHQPRSIDALVVPSPLQTRQLSPVHQLTSKKNQYQLFASSSLPLLHEEQPYEYPIPEPRRRRSRNFRPIENFAAGFLHVESDFVHLFQEYFLRRSTKVIAPWILGMLLLQSLFPAIGVPLGNSAKELLSLFYLLSQGVTRLLNAPIAAVIWLESAIPAGIIASLDYVPRTVALFLCSSMFFVSHHIRLVLDSNWSVLVNFFLLHPLVEEFQYRFVLTKSLRAFKAMLMLPERKSEVDTTDLVQFIPIDSQAGHINSVPPTVERVPSPPAKHTIRLSTTMLSILGSFLFAMTRFYWLSPDTYSIAGFVQSTMIHLSEWSFLELKPFINQVLLGLALHQSVTAWYLSRNVFFPLYQQGGLPASMGAHMAWTIGFLAMPIRWAWRGMEWTCDQFNKVSQGL